VIPADAATTVAALREELARSEERARLHAAEAQRIGEALGAANARAASVALALDKTAAALRAICRADRTTYNHHERRPWDGKAPREAGGTIWLTPREQAARALRGPRRDRPERRRPGAGAARPADSLRLDALRRRLDVHRGRRRVVTLRRLIFAGAVAAALNASRGHTYEPPKAARRKGAPSK